jgi:Rod binding domain-containing protein
MQDAFSLLPPGFANTKNPSLKALTTKVAAGLDDEGKNKAALKAAKEFESSFLTNMLEQMWTGVEAEAPFGGGHAEKVYRSMMVGEYAKSISAAGGIGIADHIYRELLIAQEGRN